MRVPPDDYFATVNNAWQLATISDPPTISFFRVAGTTIRIRTAGRPLLTGILPAFSHLRLPQPPAHWELTVDLWDGASTGVSIPPAPPNVDLFTARGEMLGYGDERFRGAFHQLGQILSVMDMQHRHAIVGVPDAARLESLHRALPLRSVLGWFLPSHHRLLVHASSVGTEKGGVLIVGAAGAGKSNTAIGSLAAGLCFAADDFCAVSADPVPAVHSLYCTCRIQSDGWAALPYPRANERDPSTQKDLHYLQRYFPNRVCAGYPLLAILVPKKGGAGSPRMQAISPTIAAAQLAFPSVSMVPDADRHMLHRLLAFARQLPSYQFDLGDRPDEIPQTIRDLIDTIAAKAAPAARWA